MKIVKVVFGGSAAMVLFAALPASAQWRTEQLRGDFAFTGTAVCTTSPAIVTPTSYTPPAGFAPNLVPLGANSETSFGTTGVVTFNGDGTGTLSGRTVTQPGSVQALDTVIPLAYSVAADRTLTVQQGPSLNTFVAGTRAGQQNSSSGVPPFVGHVSSDRRSVVFGTFDPAVETVSRVSPPVPNPVESVRICFRSFAGILIGRNPGSGDSDDDN